MRVSRFFTSRMLNFGQMADREFMVATVIGLNEQDGSEPWVMDRSISNRFLHASPNTIMMAGQC